MAVKKDNKSVPIVMTPTHQRKLALMCSNTGLTKTGVVQRLIEQADVFLAEADKLPQLNGKD